MTGNTVLASADPAGRPKPASGTRRRLRVPEPRSYPNVGWPLFGVFLFFIAFRLLQLGHRFPPLGAARLELILGLILTIGAIARLSATRPHVDTRPLSWGLALIALMGVMTALSVDPSHSFDVYIEHGVKMAVVSLFMLAWIDSPTALIWFLGAYFVSFLKMAEEGVLGTITGSLVWENQGVPRLNGPTPLYSHPNSFSGTQLGTIPFLLNFARNYPGRVRIIAVAQALAALVIIVACASRTAYVASAGWLCYQIVRSGKFLRGAIFAVVLAAVASMTLPHAYIERFESIFTQKDKEWHSIDTRRQILDDAWSIFLSHPLGVGTSAFPRIRELEFGRNQDTHNLYLEIATNLGVEGLAIFAGFVVAMWSSLTETRKRCDRLLQSVAEGITSHQCEPKDQATLEEVQSAAKLVHVVADSTIGFLLVRLLLGLFGHDLYESYWWIILGFALAGRNILLMSEKAAYRIIGEPKKIGAGRRKRTD